MFCLGVRLVQKHSVDRPWDDTPAHLKGAIRIALIVLIILEPLFTPITLLTLTLKGAIRVFLVPDANAWANKLIDVKLLQYAFQAGQTQGAIRVIRVI